MMVCISQRKRHCKQSMTGLRFCIPFSWLWLITIVICLFLKKIAFGSGSASSMKLLSWCGYSHLCIYSMLFVFCVPHVSTRQGIAEFLFQISMMFKPLINFHTLRTHRMGRLRNGPFWAKPTISRNDRAPQLCCGQKAGQEDESTKTQLLVSQ